MVHFSGQTGVADPTKQAKCPNVGNKKEAKAKLSYP